MFSDVDVEDEFEAFNNRLVFDMKLALADLNYIFGRIKADETVDINSYKEYIQIYKQIVELYYIGCRKNINVSGDVDVDSAELLSAKLNRFSKLISGAAADEL